MHRLAWSVVFANLWQPCQSSGLFGYVYTLCLCRVPTADQCRWAVFVGRVWQCFWQGSGVRWPVAGLAEGVVKGCPYPTHYNQVYNGQHHVCHMWRGEICVLHGDVAMWMQRAPEHCTLLLLEVLTDVQICSHYCIVTGNAGRYMILCVSPKSTRMSIACFLFISFVSGSYITKMVENYKVLCCDSFW